MMNEDFQLLVDISVDYYLKGMTQNEIAKTRFVSRPKVSRLLKKARKEGVVEIKINYSDTSFNEVQREAKRLFNIKNIHIVHSLDNPVETLEEVSKRAAEKISDIIKDDMTIGISFGNSVLRTAKFIERKNYKNVSIVERFGTPNFDGLYNSITNSSIELSNKLGAKLYSLPAPIYINDENARDVLMDMPVVSTTLEKIEDVDFIVSSIGAVCPESSSTFWTNIIVEDIKEDVLKRKGVGFLLAHFFDQEGKFLNFDYNRETIGISVEQIEKKRLFIICSGKSKSKALYSLLKAREIDSLVCDVDLLKEVLKHAKFHCKSSNKSI